MRKAHDEYMRAKTEHVTEPGLRVAEAWRRSDQGCVKINCDASRCRQTKMGGIDVIARNADGCVVGGANRRLSG